MTTARVKNGQLVIALGKEWGATLPQIKSLAFFPYDEGGIEYAAPQTMSRNKDDVELAMKLGDQPPKGGSIRGVLLATEQSGNDTVTLPLEIGARLSGAAVGGSAVKAGDNSETSVPVLLLLAILGGLILNLMPCVFPVLSIKAMGLVEQAKKHPAIVRTKGVVFAAGVIGSMLCLAAALLALRAGGEQIGWGFQLQSPLFVTLMVYLLLAVGLNLSGVFEVGGTLAGIGDGLTQGDGYRASFFTGVLTTLVATPCTAPFMVARCSGRGVDQTAAGCTVHFCCARFRTRTALSAAVVRTVAAPHNAETRRMDGHAQAGLRFSDLRLGGSRGCCGCWRRRRHPSAWAPPWPARSSSRWPLGPTKNRNQAVPAGV